MILTFCGAIEADVELLHAIVDQSHLVVRHQPVRRKRSAHSPKMPREDEEGSCKTHIFMTSVSIRRLGELYTQRKLVNSYFSNIFEQMTLIIVRHWS
jgi:hypothetical protein